MKKTIIISIGVLVLIFASYLIGRGTNKNSDINTKSESTNNIPIYPITSSSTKNVDSSHTKTQSQSLDDKQFKCAQLGAQAKTSYETKYPNINEVLMTNAVFHYDTKLGKCFFGRELHFSSANKSFSVWRGVTDLISNNDVLYAWDIYDTDGKRVGDFSAINYVNYPNEQGGGVIKSETEFENLYNQILTE